MIERFNDNTIVVKQDRMDIQYMYRPTLQNPIMIAAWPGMGYLAKISADYLRRRLKAKLFAEIKYFHNVLVYNNGKAELAPIKHKLYEVSEKDLIICVGDAQPSIPEESLRLGSQIVAIAKDFNVRRVYTIAAYPNEFYETPHIYGVYTHDSLKEEIMNIGIEIIEQEGAINGLNGVLIGLAKEQNIEGLCLMGDITYANVPQHLSSKVILEKLNLLLDLDIDTKQLEIRAEKIDRSIKKRLDILEEEEELLPKEDRRFGYIS